MKILIEAGNIDIDNICINVANMDIINNPYPLLDNFDTSKQIGTCTVFKHDNKLYGNIDLYHTLDINKLYPAIGYSSIRGDYTFKNRVRFINYPKLLSVSLCDNENADPLIKSIGEQLKEQ